jgi:hypothetical protein
MNKHNNVPTGTASASPHATPDSAGVVVRTERGNAVRGDRTDGALSWIGWHLGELAAVGVPTFLAVTAHPLWTVPALIVAAGWVTHEVQLARRKTRTGRTNRADVDGGTEEARPDDSVSPPLAGPTVGPDVSGEEGRRGLA